MGIKKQGKPKKISKETVSRRGGQCDQYPAISFRYLTTNKDYNFEYFKDVSKKENMFVRLTEYMADMTSKSYAELIVAAKEQGCEMIEYWRFHSMKPNGLSLAKDEKLYIFRFSKQDYRVCGVRIDSCPTMYIIGFDFNYSAYNHGN